jgi:hypothetical protein
MYLDDKIGIEMYYGGNEPTVWLDLRGNVILPEKMEDITYKYHMPQEGVFRGGSSLLLVEGPWSALYELALRAALPFQLSGLGAASLLGRSGGALMDSDLKGMTWP